MPKINLDVEVNTESMLGRIAEAKAHLQAAERILNSIHWWESKDTISAKETAASDCESDTTANPKSCISGITIMLHGDADTAADGKITEQ